jgi:hypothetical protein
VSPSPSSARGTGVAALLLVLVFALGLAGCGDDDDAPDGATTTGAGAPAANGAGTGQDQSKKAPGPQPETIVIRDGEPVGGPRELEYDAGEPVLLLVRSDVADEVHVHGYDLSKEVPAGGEVGFSFTADIEGIFEVELEERGEPIAELRVNP